MTTGIKCCEHYPEGLPVCSKCREESQLAHDKACALLAEARADADHWKSECNALQCMVHESRAEIENLKWHINSEKAKAEAALALNDRALGLVNEARARIDHLERIIDEMTEEQASLCAEGQSITELVAAKDKLIEQMWEALKAIDGIGREAGNARREDALRCFAIAAAALAAERGE